MLCKSERFVGVSYTQSLVSFPVQAEVVFAGWLSFLSGGPTRRFFGGRLDDDHHATLMGVSAAAKRRRPVTSWRVRNGFRVINRNGNRLMPSVAEPDIAIDIVTSAGRSPGAHDLPGHPFHPRPRLLLSTLGLAGLDAAVTICVALLAYGVLNPLHALQGATVSIPMACLTLCVNLSFLERGLYAPADVVSRQLNWRKLALAWVQAVAVGTLLIFCIASLSGRLGVAGLTDMTETLIGPWVPVLLPAGFAGLLAARFLRIRAHGGTAPANRTVIIGEHESIRDLLHRIATAPRRAFDVVGVVEHINPVPDVAPPAVRRSFRGLPLFSGIDALERMIRQDAVDTVLVALPWAEGERAQAIIRQISMAPIDVYIYAGMDGASTKLRGTGAASDLPLLVACNRPINGWRAHVKRAEDVILSLGLLAFISPVMLAIAIAIKSTSHGPVFFRQRRVGYNNRVIEVLKFRSMFTHLSDADATQQTSRGDKRVTPVGAWLRRTSLDELPQLLNVLRGDMSLVGPRPHALATTAGGLALEEAVPVYSSRHRVKPGITGWAQVNGYRGALDTVDKIVHRVNHDLYYIENWSLGLDIKILWQTVRVVFADDNAF
jgi:Undecaprenyl-phosphate glucose phosphotransferase